VGFWTNLFFGGDESNFDTSTAKIDLFQVDASEDQRQQYERFVVIKEACGNLFIAWKAPALIALLIALMAATVKAAITSRWFWRKANQRLPRSPCRPGGHRNFGRKCLMARRLAEAGVRFIQVTDGGWDHHDKIDKNLRKSAKGVDQPVAGLPHNAHSGRPFWSE
jgi:hypothetical protein